MTALADKTLPPGPYPLFEKWHETAEAHEHISYAGAMTLSTVAADGFPEGRIVLLHDAGPGEGFAFFTDARSRKGQSLAQTPRAALTFYWGPLERQVRVQGRVVRAPSREADRFFEERPRRSRLTAWASPQSRPLEDAAALEARMSAVEERFADREAIPRPSYWAAYRVQPRRVEFWEAKARRLHTRVEYERDGPAARAWRVRRLAP